ncbi:hypothetical protein BDN72DRAFT_500731 [Pluteus cervinus]|uniref:Uncharacterized protein n=1 Tax=Pluteus cervinus TaxID=181527 RepID=A0ACD3AYU1_9AGAR|nr:hypothetical protein BDN72DRAFT_500731 [Pluteus cervinus]
MLIEGELQQVVLPSSRTSCSVNCELYSWSDRVSLLPIRRREMEGFSFGVLQLCSLPKKSRLQASRTLRGRRIIAYTRHGHDLHYAT